MKYINSKTKSKDYSHLGIGTDFDGLADSPADLYTNSQLKDLISAMQADPVVAPYVDKITWSNSLRILEHGWGPRGTHLNSLEFAIFLLVARGVFTLKIPLKNGAAV
jgi:hypothetical protein